MVNFDEENEEDGEDGERKESMLKLFLMVTQDDEDMSSCTPKRRSPTKVVALKDVQVLEL